MLQRRLIKEGISAYHVHVTTANITEKYLFSSYEGNDQYYEDSGVKSKDFKTENVNLKIKQYSRKLVES